MSSIAATPFATVTLVVLGDDGTAGTAGRALAAPLKEGALFELYARVDRHVFGAALDALAAVDISPHLTRVFTVKTARADDDAAGRTAHHSCLYDVIREADLDVMVDLGRRPLAAEARRGVRYGVWSYRVAEAVDADSASFFRQRYERNPIVETILTVWHRSDGREHVLYRSGKPCGLVQ